MLKQRIVSGSLLAAVLIGIVLYAPGPWFAAAFALLYGIGAWEWARLTSLRSPLGETLFVGSYIALVAMLWWGRDGHLLLIWVWASAAFWLLAFFALRRYHRSADQQPRWQTLLAGLGLLLLPAAWGAFIELHTIHPGWVLYVMALCGLADSFAFVFGKLFGKHKLAPSLSPGKTIEGALGGLLSVFVFSILVAIYWQHFSLWPAVAFVSLSLVVGLISIEGDLFESLIKREARQKDSGRILPGHGGILDRFDSHISAAPIFYLGLTVLLAWSESVSSG